MCDRGKHPLQSSCVAKLTWGRLNGLGWKQWADAVQLEFVKEYGQRSNLEPGRAAVVKRALDLFYLASANALIPVADALDLVTRQMSGASESEIQGLVEHLRMLSAFSPE